MSRTFLFLTGFASSSEDGVTLLIAKKIKQTTVFETCQQIEFLSHFIMQVLSNNFYSLLFSGNPQGKNQPDGILKGDRPFLIAPFTGGEKVTFRVPHSDNTQWHSKSN